MNHARSISALALTGALLLVSPGAATAKITESDDRGSGSSTSAQPWRLDVNEETGAVTRVPDWYASGAGTSARTGTDSGAARNDIGPISEPASRPDVGAARNDVGPAAPAEPRTTPVTTGVDTGLVVGWTAAAAAAASAFIAAVMFLRRRRENLAHPA